MCFAVNMCTYQMPISLCDITPRTKLQIFKQKTVNIPNFAVFSIRQNQFKTVKTTNFADLPDKSIL